MKKTFKPLATRFRASFAAGETSTPRLGKVDRESMTLHDVQITLEGEAKGHGVYLDREFCEACAARGNEIAEKNGAGLKVRFGHPAMCSDAIGTYLGRAKNFRVVDVTRTESGESAAGVVADVVLDANADRAEWVLNMAESAPDTFGQSIVFTYADWVVKDADGNRHSYAEEVEGTEEKRGEKTEKAWREQSADDRVYAVFGELLGSDFTDTPAATDGVFSDTSLAAEAERILDEHPQIAETLEKHPDNVYQFLSRVGILDRIESKRVAGIQAEKDKELAALAEKHKEEIDALAEKCKADMAAIESAHATELDLLHVEHNKALAESAAALDAAKAEIEQLRAEVATGNSALAEVSEQYEILKTQHAELTGAALSAPSAASSKYANFAEAVDELGYVEACRQYPHLRATYRAKGK